MSKKPRVLEKFAEVKKFQGGGGPHFKGATPGGLTRALMRRTRPFEPAGKRDAREGTQKQAPHPERQQQETWGAHNRHADRHSIAKHANRLKRSTIKTCCAVLCAFS